MPFLLLFCCLQTTGPREKPEEEKEDEVEGGAFHGLPQVPLRHIVTKLIISIIYHTRAHTHAHTPTNLWMSGNSPAVVKLREHKRDWGLVEE